VFSVIGGLFGTTVLIFGRAVARRGRAQVRDLRILLARAARLTCAVFIAVGDALKGFVSLLIGLLVASVGLDNPQRFRASRSATRSSPAASRSSR
jgi:TctA family transporter